MQDLSKAKWVISIAISTVAGAALALTSTFLFSSAAEEAAPNSDKDDLFWASEIRSNPGYILWFRHAEREKWNGTVTVFDWLEAEKGLDGRDQEWFQAVCLTQKGIIESKLVAVVNQELGLEAIKVVSSPSCRARETALNATGRIDEIWLEALHATAVSSEQQKDFSKFLKTKLDDLRPALELGNVMVFGHGNTLNFYQNEIFAETLHTGSMSELGFSVLGYSVEGGWVLHHVFEDYFEFANSQLSFTSD